MMVRAPSHTERGCSRVCRWLACLHAIGQKAVETSTSSDSKYTQIFRQKIVHLLALWTLVYVGVEVTVGGWSVTYVVQDRNGGPSSGYISSGFFGGTVVLLFLAWIEFYGDSGLTLGRVALLWVNAKV